VGALETFNFQHYVIRLVNERRTTPKEDLISDLLETAPGEKPFDDAELASVLTSTILAVMRLWHTS